VIGSDLVSPGEMQQLPLRIRQAATARKLAQPSRQFAVMRSGILPPPIPVGGRILQWGRVFIWHASRFGRKSLLTRKILAS
jgi:hypothetical protein